MEFFTNGSQDEVPIPNTVDVFEKAIARIESRSGIDIDTIELIHGLERQQDGYVSFCQKVNNNHHDLAGIKITKLSKYLDGILDFLLKDSYFSVNASYSAAPYINERTGLPSAWRKERVLRYLNSTYADVDFYKATPSLDWPSAVKIIMKAQDEKKIPPASIIARSGRGMYLLWLLTSGRGGVQQSAFPHEIELYKQTNKSIYKRLNEINPRLNSDPIFDAARILRVPSSINTKSGLKVAYLIQVLAGGLGVPVYTLGGLADFFKIPSLPTQQIVVDYFPRKTDGSCPKRSQGRRASGWYRYQDALTIFQNIKGFQQGRRRLSLTYVARFLKAAAISRHEIIEMLESMAKGCRPPYPSDKSDTPVEKIVSDVWMQTTRKFFNWKLARFFNITPEKAEELSLQSIIPKETAKKRKARPSIQEEARRDRRAFIKKYIRKHPGRRPSCRKMQRMLEAHQMKVGFRTISTDINFVIDEINR